MNCKTPIASGNTAEIFLHEDKIIKLFKDFLPNGVAKYEADKQMFVASQGLSVPCIYEVTEINGQQAIIMEHINGKTIGSIIFNDITKAEKYMKLSVEVQLKIHNIKTDELVQMFDKLTNQIQCASVISEKQKNALLEKLNNMEYENRLCHGDYHVNNLILCDQDVSIIDWADASAGDVKADVCRSYLLYSQHYLELADLYLRLYCEKSGLSENDILAWMPIIAGARLSENVVTEDASRLLDLVANTVTNKY